MIRHALDTLSISVASSSRLNLRRATLSFVVMSSLLVGGPGERVKTNRRDATMLARLHRAGEVTAVWVPDAGHEAMCDLVRAREAAMADLRRAP